MCPPKFAPGVVVQHFMLPNFKFNTASLYALLCAVGSLQVSQWFLVCIFQRWLPTSSHFIEVDVRNTPFSISSLILILVSIHEARCFPRTSVRKRNDELSRKTKTETTEETRPLIQASTNMPNSVQGEKHWLLRWVIVHSVWSQHSNTCKDHQEHPSAPKNTNSRRKGKRGRNTARVHHNTTPG